METFLIILGLIFVGFLVGYIAGFRDGKKARF
jgi:hypothetical protein